ncbi:MAG TPA: hypothetical protein VMF69_10490 [Gemmataceae bacterium]|nr:hypothetical protein [Gemmataceae bacterium]
MSSVPPSAPHPGRPGQPMTSPPAAAAPTVPAQNGSQPAVPAVLVAPPPAPDKKKVEELRIYSHSTFFYWWPVWVAGYIMAAVTRMHGQTVQIGNTEVWMDYSKNMGVLFTLIFFLVILFTNITLRGMASVVVILVIAFVTLLFAYMGWWEDVLSWMGRLSIFMNMGFYVFFSSLVLLVWAVSVFVYDRLTYWRVTPGQLTHDTVIGGAQRSYDTRGMVFEKQRQDLFRHWILGFGSGDIEISTVGARRETFSIPNVLFVDAKVSAIQRMIAMQPDQFEATPPS